MKNVTLDELSNLKMVAGNEKRLMDWEAAYREIAYRHKATLALNAELLAALQNLLAWANIRDDAGGQSGQLRDQSRAAIARAQP